MNLGVKIKELRTKRGLSLSALSKMTGFTRSFISQIENEKTSPSIASLIKIADALNVKISELFLEDTPDEKILIRKKDREIFYNKRSKVKFEMLAPRIPDRKIQPVLAYIEPGGSSGTYQGKGFEFGILLKGKSELTIGDKKYLLEEGDSVYFDSSIPHCWKNISKEESIALWVGSSSYF